MRHVLAAAAVAAGVMSFVSPAAAYVMRGAQAPWCAVMSMGAGGVHEDCSYMTYEACVPNVIAGNRGFCNRNPAYRGPMVVEHRRHKKRHVHAY